MNEHGLIVSRIQSETPLSKIITFSIPKRLRKYYVFKPRQFITISFCDSEGLKHLRCYSICSSTKQKDITIGVKKVDNGLVSSYLVDRLVVGDQINVGLPAGKFTVATSILHVKNYVLIAGGSGITPIKSIIQKILKNEPFSKITLIYGNYNEENIIFYNFFNGIRSMRFKIINCLTQPSSNWKGETGRLDKVKCLEIIHVYNIAYKRVKFYLCGPSAMMQEAKCALNELDVPRCNIFQEVITSKYRYRYNIT